MLNLAARTKNSIEGCLGAPCYLMANYISKIDTSRILGIDKHVFHTVTIPYLE
jgi:hypothetical protein